ncbi:unnamed protein product [Meloidogyne enterolobii]|uniref:Uncharacterized protein n=1 Tax=Meloidogyne enterolobii TaxID=390850 RepID=A0ACB0YKY2_MELEN
MNNNSSSTSNNNNSPSTTAIAYAVAAAGIPLNSRNSSSFNSLTDQQQQHSSNFYSNKTCHFEQQSGDYLCHYNTSAPFNHFTQQNRGHFDDCTATNYSTDPSTQQQLQLSACNGLYQLEHNANIGLHTSIIPYQRSVQLATTTFHHPQNYPNNLNCYSNFTQPVVDWSGGNTSGRTGGDLYLRVDATLEIGTANSIGGSAAYNWHMGGSGGNHNLIPQFNQHHHNNNNSMIDCLTSNNSQINNNFGINCQKQTTNSLIGTSTNCLQISQTSSQQLPNNLIKTQQQQYSPEKPFRSIKKLKNIKKEIQTTKKFISSPNKNKFYVCNICGRQYCRKSTLKAHMKNHVGERPFICPICGKHFSQAANLTAHRRVHTGEKPFSCPVCYRPFSQSSSLVTHKRTHTGERPYPCPHCEKAFTDSSTLTKHLRTHTGQKPYSCAICAMRFSQSGNLHRHMKTHTSEIR